MTENSQSVNSMSLADLDPDVAAAMNGELSRQRDTLEMIASENFVPRAVLQAQGSVLTNKYAEGYPGRRYYGGCEYVDVVEDIARNRAKELFGADFANVQPHSGAQANAAVLQALMEPGETLLGLDLAHGGHLTHGMRLNFSGKLYENAFYGVSKEDFRVDMDEVRKIALDARPKVIVAGWSAYPRTLDFAAFREIADEVGARLWVDMAHFAGLVAAGLHPSPVPHADVVSSTVHKTLGGPRSGIILAKQEWAKKLNSAVFPGQQGGPLMHAIAGKAVALKIAGTEEFAERQRRTLSGAKLLAERLTGADVARRVSRCSPAAPMCTWCWSICATAPSTASRPRTSCIRWVSRSTATPCRSTPARRWSPPACGSAPRRWPPADSVTSSSPRSPTSSVPRWPQARPPMSRRCVRACRSWPWTSRCTRVSSRGV